LNILMAYNKNILLEEELALISRSLILEPSEVKQIVYATNEYRLQLSELETKNMHLEVQVHDLRHDLKVELEKEAPNIEEMTDKLAREKIEEVRRKFEYERDQMIKDL